MDIPSNRGSTSVGEAPLNFRRVKFGELQCNRNCNTVHLPYASSRRHCDLRQRSHRLSYRLSLCRRSTHTLVLILNFSFPAPFFEQSVLSLQPSSLLHQATTHTCILQVDTRRSLHAPSQLVYAALVLLSFVSFIVLSKSPVACLHMR